MAWNAKFREKGGSILKRYCDEAKPQEGFLPGCAPLAYPFVPFQCQDPPKYEAPKAWVRGTVFPGLDLPFKGMVNQPRDRLCPGEAMQAAAFYIQDLALYLDTHPQDTQALELYRSYQAMHQKAAQNYNANVQVLNHKMPSQGAYGWLAGPWPWEYAANKEG